MNTRVIHRLRRLHRQRGFLLLEAIMAITVVTLGTVAIMRTYTNSLSAAVLSQQYLAASNLAEQIIWQAVSAPDVGSLPATSDGKFDPPHEQYSWSRTIKATFPELGESGEIEDFSDPVNTGEEDEEEDDDEVYILYEIKVAVSWEYRRHPRELNYQTAVMRKQPESETEEFDEIGTF